MGVRTHQCGTHLVHIELDHDAAGLVPHLPRGAIIEDGDGTVGLAPGVVLEGKSGTWAHLEIALLAPKAPYDLAGFTVDFVDGGGFASGDEQVGVVIHVYGVD